MIGIQYSCWLGYWKEFGINKWNDLLNLVFSKINQKISVLKYYKGIKGLNLAKQELIEFSKKNNRIPRNYEFLYFKRAFQKRFWSKYGINSWNDLLKEVFGKINRHRNGFIETQEGLQSAKDKLISFFKKYKRLPKSKEFSFITSCYLSGSWKDFGIESWNDLLQLTFGKVNNKFEHWKGKKGLIKAKNKALNFYKIHKRLPKSTEKQMEGISNASNNKTWKNQGIQNWNDFLKFVFGQVNLRSNIWIGERGFKRAKEWMIDFFEKNKRLPKSENNPGIYQACRKGYWRDFGIKSWNDFLKLLFGKTNRERPSWKGEKGLIRAIERVRDFYSENNRLPNSGEKGFSGIYEACKKGYWKELNVDSWVQFKELSLSSYLKTLKQYLF